MPKKETVKEFLARGGKITKLPIKPGDAKKITAEIREANRRKALGLEGRSKHTPITPMARVIRRQENLQRRRGNAIDQFLRSKARQAMKPKSKIAALEEALKEAKSRRKGGGLLGLGLTLASLGSSIREANKK